VRSDFVVLTQNRAVRVWRATRGWTSRWPARSAGWRCAGCPSWSGSAACRHFSCPGSSHELVPGLLQTAGYARALIRAGHPELDEDEIGRRVELRMVRQSLLTRAADPPTLQVVVNEAALRWPVGYRLALYTVSRPLLSARASSGPVPGVKRYGPQICR
jgi:hypothetical protein